MEDDKKKQAEAEAAARKAARDAANAEELAALKSAQDAEAAGLQAYNKAQYDNIGQIIGDPPSMPATPLPQSKYSRTSSSRTVKESKRISLVAVPVIFPWLPQEPHR